MHLVKIKCLTDDEILHGRKSIYYGKTNIKNPITI